ncbi:MAG: hypothetical protein V1857_01240 [archaeon]
MRAVLSRFDGYPERRSLEEVLEEFVRLFGITGASSVGDSHTQSAIMAKYDDALRNCEDFQDVFTLVRQCTGSYLGRQRNDMVLQLVEMPLHIGAAHPVGTNRIVMNKALLDLAVQNRSFSEVKAFVFSILLHEYIHSLGYLNEYETRELVFLVTQDAFGPDHVVTHVARYGPWHIFRRLPI